MSDINNKIEQCKRDIEILQKNLKELEDQQKKTLIVPVHGDVVRHADGSGLRIIVRPGQLVSLMSLDNRGLVQARESNSLQTLYAVGDYKVIGNVFAMEKK